MTEIDKLTAATYKKVEEEQQKLIKNLLIGLGHEVSNNKQFERFARERCRIVTGGSFGHEIKTLFVDDKPMIRWSTEIDFNTEYDKETQSFKSSIKYGKPQIIG